MRNPTLLSLAIFAVCWLLGIYLINCLIAREVKRVDTQQALLHFATMAMIGLVGEICVGSFYHFLFHRPLWNYTIYPIHHAYTSRFALFLWGIYGFHLYLLHGTLKRKKVSSLNHLALIFCLEAIIIEASVNVTYKLSFHKYIYYYFPGDLWHLTSVQTLPFYLIAGYIVVRTFRKFEQDIQFFTMFSIGMVWVLAFLT
jgi:hypothetical protein